LSLLGWPILNPRRRKRKNCNACHSAYRRDQLTDKAGSVSTQCVSPIGATMFTFLSAACCVGVALAQTAGAPAPVAATPTLYQRPNNSDCVTTTSSVTNFFPLQFQIAGSSTGTPQQAQVNVRFALSGARSVHLHTNHKHYSSLPS